MQVDTSAQPHHQATHPKPVDFSDRVLTEAVGVLDRLNPELTRDPLAEQIGRSVQGDLERKLIVYAKSLPASMTVENALRHVKQAIVLMIMAALVLGAIGGVAAARAGLATQRGEPVNIYWALGAVLGVQTLFLVLWIAVMIGARRATPGAVSFTTLGGLVMRGAQFIASKVHKGPQHAAAIAATGAVHLRGSLGTWTISSISHGVWLVFNVACLLVLIVALSARKYSFAWETTILSESQYVPLTKAIAVLPKAAGFITPDDEQIASSQWRGQPLDDSDANQAWSGLLIGCLVLYGFAPRLLLFAFSIGRRRFLAARYRIDTEGAAFTRLRAELNPPATPLGIIDPDQASAGEPSTTIQRPTARAREIGSPAILGFELPAKPGAAWPPTLHQVRWLDLGMVDTRDDQRRVITQLSAATTEPQTVAVVCSLTSAPDRGTAAFLRELTQVVSRHMAIVLTSGEALRKRSSSDDVQQRIDDWHALARAAGVLPSRIVEVDLDHLTQSSAAKFAALIAATRDVEPRHVARHIEQAFDLITDQARHWHGLSTAPSEAEQAELHRRIARLYEHDRSAWRDVLGAARSLGSGASPIGLSNLSDGANRVLKLLPAHLRASPKWIAAGAAAGAFGCIAAATLISPAAIAALPMWSTIGGSISGVLALSRSQKLKQQPPDDTQPMADHLNPIRAAALFALLLELQGRDEKAITRVLDETLSNQEELISSGSAATWLHQLRHRFDLALARELTS
jgi:hypothetical protein